MSCSLPRAPAELVCGVGSHAVASDPLLMLKDTWASAGLPKGSKAREDSLVTSGLRSAKHTTQTYTCEKPLMT